jgi:phosphatidylserine decarboxylase
MSSLHNSASLMDWLKVFPQYLLPKHLLSLGMHRLTRIRQPLFKNWLIKKFIHLYRVDMSEAVEENPTVYAHFNDFFTRALKPGARPVTAPADIITSPVDGTISQIAQLDGEQLIQAKNHHYRLTQLLADDTLAQQFSGGTFTTIYLAPSNYHRIHMPCDGALKQMHYLPGDLFSVNPHTARCVPGLLARNERVVTLFETPNGPMILILVGAIFVGSMDVAWEEASLTPPYGNTPKKVNYKDGQVNLKKGEEMGRFNMGSTIILLFPAGKARWQTDCQSGQTVRMGQTLGESIKHV